MICYTHWDYYCLLDGGSMLSDVIGHSYPRIYVTTNFKQSDKSSYIQMPQIKSQQISKKLIIHEHISHE